MGMGERERDNGKVQIKCAQCIEPWSQSKLLGKYGLEGGEKNRTEQNRREENKKLKWTYQKVVKMSLLNTSMFILLLLVVLEYLFICALLWVPLCNFSHSRRSRWQCESDELWTLMGTDTWTGTSSSRIVGRLRFKSNENEFMLWAILLFVNFLFLCAFYFLYEFFWLSLLIG